ncbi:hypothetical protein MNAB215_1161 [Mycobacterium numidiamassiliense]|jgi:hypothetical protein|uniref:Uncharacterized protein n=1 Tax=Mycobacterium numidiamassiliense TaxID=1841861 RepID=A0A2U3P5H0_9MYCO|nr:hypothetical protein [Mycobacterium numidiamassiliense]SPM38980.1 hypothetical protein MNAB215_1161 [Mycobacterium numidiamassiliense]
MGITGWIAIAAFVISLVSLMQGLFLAWLKWPRVVVEVDARHDGELNAPASEHRVRNSSGQAFILTVINNGSEPVTIKSVGLARRGETPHRLDYLHTWRGPTTDPLPKSHGVEGGVVMPLWIAGHGSYVFEFTESTLREMPPGVPYHGYAQRYLAFRWRPNHPLVRETRSKQTVMRA